MPDISMCMDDECPARAKCYRHKASGTTPSKPWQTYSDFPRPAEDERCDSFWPVRGFGAVSKRPDDFTQEEFSDAARNITVGDATP